MRIEQCLCWSERYDIRFTRVISGSERYAPNVLRSMSVDAVSGSVRARAGAGARGCAERRASHGAGEAEPARAGGAGAILPFTICFLAPRSEAFPQ